MNQGSTTVDTQEALLVLEGAYLGRVDKELEKRVDEALDSIAAEGEAGIKILVQRLFRGFEIVGSDLQFRFWGDPEMGHNEWLKKVAIVNALERAHARSAVRELEALLDCRAHVAQFYDLLQPTAAWALGNIGDQRAVASLRAALGRSDVYERTKAAIRAALERLEGIPIGKASVKLPKKWWHMWN